jgi:hypothetical protein
VKKPNVLTVFSLLALFVFPVLVLAQTTPQPDTSSVITGLLTAFAGKKWAILVGFILTGVTYLVKNHLLAGWKWAQTDRGGAVVAIGIAVIGTLGAELTAGILSLGTILDAVVAAIMSAGGFNLLNKIIRSPSPSTPTTSTPSTAGGSTVALALDPR